MVLHAALVEQSAADEQIALIDTARIRRECRTGKREAAAECGDQRIGDGADVAGVGAVEGGAVLEEELPATGRAQPGRVRQVLSSIACRTGAVRDFSATTTASASGAGSSGLRHADELHGAHAAAHQHGAEIGGSREVVRDCAQQHGVILPVAGTVCRGGRWLWQACRAAPAEDAPPATSVMASACAGRALRAASAVPSISARCMRSAVRGMRQSLGADAVVKPRAHECTFGAADPKCGAEALVAPHVASEGGAHQCIVWMVRSPRIAAIDGEAREERHRQCVAQSCEPRRGDEIEQCAAHDSVERRSYGQAWPAIHVSRAVADVDGRAGPGHEDAGRPCTTLGRDAGAVEDRRWRRKIALRRPHPPQPARRRHRAAHRPTPSRRTPAAVPTPPCGRMRHPAAQHPHRPGSSPDRAR